MRYIITQISKESIEHMHPHFFQTYGIQQLGECDTCEHFKSEVCLLRESFPHVTDEDGYCSDYAELTMTETTVLQIAGL